MPFRDGFSDTLHNHRPVGQVYCWLIFSISEDSDPRTVIDGISLRFLIYFAFDPNCVSARQIMHDSPLYGHLYTEAHGIPPSQHVTPCAGASAGV
jgi:hypothetical protein